MAVIITDTAFSLPLAMMLTVVLLLSGEGTADETEFKVPAKQAKRDQSIEVGYLCSQFGWFV